MLDRLAIGVLLIRNGKHTGFPEQLHAWLVA